MSHIMDMSEPHVITALKEKRAELAGELKLAERRVLQVRVDLAILDRTLCIFDPDAAPHKIRPVVRRRRSSPFKFGTWTRTVIDLLRRSETPLSVRDIAAQIATENKLDVDAPGAMNRLANKVRNTLGRQRDGILSSEWVGDVVMWRVAD